LNNKKLLRTETSAIFLAIVLVLGTFAAISPSSFIIGAQAQEYYGQDKSYKKSDKKDVSVKSIKCNNVNVNVNGLELNGLPPFLVTLLASDGQDGYGDASSYGSGSYGNIGQSGYDNKNSFKFVCINNNNNTVIGGEVQIPPIPPTPPTPCELCFAELSTQAQENINNFLATNGLIPIPLTVPSVSIPADVDTIKELCAFLSAQQITVNAQELGLGPFVSFFINLTGDPIAAPLLVTCLVGETRIFNIIT
jgi:hypothetical protein